MSTSELQSQIERWCREQGQWDVSPQQPDSSTDFLFTLRDRGPATLALELRKGKGQGHLGVQLQLTVPMTAVSWEAARGQGQPAFTLALMVERLVEGRAGLVRGETEAQDSAYVVRFLSTVYLDGLGMHAFLSALEELRKTKCAFDRSLEDIRHQREMMDDLLASIDQASAKSEQIMQENGQKLVVRAPAPAERRCPQCQAVAPSTARFCKFDGTPIGR